MILSRSLIHLVLFVLLSALAAKAQESTSPKPQPALPAAQKATKPAPAGASEPIIYNNADYGFCFQLPAGWEGYTIVVEQWEGVASKGDWERGPLLRIRHRDWNAAHPHQDFPIMVFTRRQWRRVSDDQISISTAPFGPGELGENGKFVFALPPLYNANHADGWEEVQNAFQTNPLRTPCEAGPTRRWKHWPEKP
jgi:hypothetical protein